MSDPLDIVRIADLYAAALGGLPEKTVSYRVFSDSKKLAMIRGGADITVGRYNMAMRWFAAFWPEGHSLPRELGPFLAQTQRGAA